MTNVSLSLQDFKQGTLVTLAFCSLYLAALVMQGLTREKYRAQARKKKEKFLVTDERLYPLNRLVGNLLEWSVVFLPLFWVVLVATQGASLWLGWVYIAARSWYFVLVCNGAIRTSGPRTIILTATVPAYCVLYALIGKAAIAVAF
jgi:hypothetical protein